MSSVNISSCPDIPPEPSQLAPPPSPRPSSVQSVEDLVKSFFPQLEERDRAWICKACSQINPVYRDTILSQVQQIIPPGIKVVHITKIMNDFKRMPLEKDTISQAKRLIREGMSGDEISQITQVVHELESYKREEIVTHALSLVSPEMTGSEIAVFLSLLKKKQYEAELPHVVEITLKLSRPTMRVAEVKEILETIIDAPSYVLDPVIHLTQRLITDATPAHEICEIIKGIQKAPSEEREDIVVQFQKLDTQEMNGEMKKEILLALQIVPSERRELIRTRVGLHLAPNEKISLQFMSARTEEYFRRLTQGLSNEDIPEMMKKMEERLAPEEIEKICEHSLPLFSEKMGVKTRISIMIWVANRWNQLRPFKPVPYNVRFSSRRNPSSPSLLLKDLPRDLQWRLTIDRQDQEKGRGPSCFDQSPHTSTGYRPAMEGSLKLIDHICDLRMNHHLLELLHDVCVDEVFDTEGRLAKGYRPGWSYSYNLAEIPETSRKQMELENRSERLIFTPEIERELKEQSKNVMDEKRYYLAESKVPDASGWVTVKSLFTHANLELITTIFDQFYMDAACAVTMDQKYAAVAKCCRALIVLHAFPDGNGRTICFNLLMILLHQIGSPPCIPMRPPYFFNGTKTIQEMVGYIKEGVEYFQRKKIEVLIGEYAEMTPADKDAEDYLALRDFYQLLDPCFTSERK